MKMTMTMIVLGILSYSLSSAAETRCVDTVSRAVLDQAVADNLGAREYLTVVVPEMNNANNVSVDWYLVEVANNITSTNSTYKLMVGDSNCDIISPPTLQL
jgi:hypothetical protein